MIYNVLNTINTLDLFSDSASGAKQVIRTLFGRLSALIYSLIENLYNVFIYVSKAQILEDSYVQDIYRRVGMILGIFMLFKLMFSLIKSLVDPDKLGDDKNGIVSIIKRTIIAIILLGVTPALFKEAYNIQNLLVGTKDTDNVIYKLISNKDSYSNPNNMGRIIASDLFFCFYRDDKSPILNNGMTEVSSGYEGTIDAIYIQDNYENLKKQVEAGNLEFSDTIEYLKVVSSKNIYAIEFNELLSIAFGIFMVWIFITYCIQVGVRVVQLAYLQIVAPIPILSYISDPEGTFKRWTQQCLTTYLDLFLRLAIIYFAVTVIGDVIVQFENANGIIMVSTGLAEDAASGSTIILVKIFIILGLLLFAKKVPELIKDLFPNFGGGAAGLSLGVKKPKDTIGDIPLIGNATNKVLGYAGNVGKKVAGFAWNATGKRLNDNIKNRISTRDENIKKKQEVKQQVKAANSAYDKYGKDWAAAKSSENYQEMFENYKKIFKNAEYAKSYADLQKKKDAIKNLDTNSATYATRKAELDSAQERHNIYRNWHADLANLEDNLKLHDKLNITSNKNQNSENQNIQTPTASQPQTTRET